MVFMTPEGRVRVKEAVEGLTANSVYLKIERVDEFEETGGLLRRLFNRPKTTERITVCCLEFRDDVGATLYRTGYMMLTEGDSVKLDDLPIKTFPTLGEISMKGSV